MSGGKRTTQARRVVVRVLLVEDNELLARGQCNTLRQLGAEIAVAHDLGGARRQLRERIWDGVIIDVGLPDGSGLDLLSELRDTQARTPVLVQSAIADCKLPNRAHLLDAAFVYKPFDPAQVRKFLKGVRARRRRRHDRLAEAAATFTQTYELSEAEGHILGLVLEGNTPLEIAQTRGTSNNTVKTQIRSLLRKAACRTTPQLASQVFLELWDE